MNSRIQVHRSRLLLDRVLYVLKPSLVCQFTVDSGQSSNKLNAAACSAWRWVFQQIDHNNGVYALRIRGILATAYVLRLPKLYQERPRTDRFDLYVPKANKTETIDEFLHLYTEHDIAADGSTHLCTFQASIKRYILGVALHDVIEFLNSQFPDEASTASGIKRISCAARAVASDKLNDHIGMQLDSIREQKISTVETWFDNSTDCGASTVQAKSVIERIASPHSKAPAL